VPLFGPVHLALIAAIAALSAVSAWLCRSQRWRLRGIRSVLGLSLAFNEIVWYGFRYSQEGFRFPDNLPLQLCDFALWMVVIACLTASERAVEFAYFAGLGGAAMAILTPDLWAPWPSYPAIYFFLVHGGIVIAVSVLVWGRPEPLRAGAVNRAFAMVVGYAGIAGLFNAVFGTNYMYLCRKPASASLLDALGPWPLYLFAGGVVAYGVFWLLWLAVRPRRVSRPAWAG
jgi:hypothetical integral membrane protein (TIGR02206 family)